MGIVKFTFVIQTLRLAHHHATEAVNGELFINSRRMHENYDHVITMVYLDVMQMMIPQAQLSPLA